jgi:hypothetical protein
MYSEKGLPHIDVATVLTMKELHTSDLKSRVFALSAGGALLL